MCLFIIIILIVVNISLFSFPTHKHFAHVIWGRKLVVPRMWYDLGHIISIPSYILTWIIIIIIDIPLINGYLLLWMVVLLWFVVVEFGQWLVEWILDRVLIVMCGFVYIWDAFVYIAIGIVITVKTTTIAIVI